MKCVELPIRVISRSNSREHWRLKAKRTAFERACVAKAALLIRGVLDPHTIVLTRCGKRVLDSDNLGDALKAIRDEVAKQLGFANDADPLLHWVYEQEAPRDYAVRIEIYGAVEMHARTCA